MKYILAPGLLLVGFLAFEAFRANHAVEVGKRWCMKVIAELESGTAPPQASGLPAGLRVMDPDGEWTVHTPNLYVSKDGRFKCSVPEPSLLALFPGVHVYSSDHPQWERLD